MRTARTLAAVCVAGAAAAWAQTAPDRAAKAPPSFPLGIYRLGMAASDGEKWREFPPVEREAFGLPVGLERTVLAPAIAFAGSIWRVALAIDDGKVGRIVLHLETASQDSGIRTFYFALSYAEERLGQASRPRGGLYQWATADGPLTLELGWQGDAYLINWTLSKPDKK
jgi:hypothetical protein